MAVSSTDARCMVGPVVKSRHALRPFDLECWSITECPECSGFFGARRRKTARLCVAAAATPLGACLGVLAVAPLAARPSRLDRGK